MGWIETALEESKVVIVPEESETELSWKVLVTDETLLSLEGYKGDQWRVCSNMPYGLKTAANGT